MKIDYYNPECHKGSQPVRVLYQNIKHWFKYVYPEFKTTELQTAIEEFELHEDLNIIEREDKIASPAFVGSFKIISIQETYLSYLWGLTYSLLFLYDKSIHEPRISEPFVVTNKLKDKTEKAHQLFKYSLSLLDNYNPWDKENLPNPEYYDRLYDDYIEKANGAYLHAVNFILVHELGHVVLGHVDKDIENDEKGIELSLETKIQDEIEADNFSFDRMFKTTEHLTNNHTASVGLIAALCSFIFFNSTMSGGDHPDPDKKLQSALERLELAEEDNLWGISCLAFRLWAIHHKIDLKWPKIIETYKDLFYLTMERLEEIKE
ncbi:MAG: phage exclusion protein Lit family protein [Bacteroidota bacterium]